MHQFVDFLGTKHGLARVWEGDADGFTALHTLFVDELVPVLGRMLDDARASGEVVASVSPYQLLRAVGDLVAWSPQDPDYDVRHDRDAAGHGAAAGQPTGETQPAGGEAQPPAAPAPDTAA